MASNSKNSDFLSRHIGLSDQDVDLMVKELGFHSLDNFIDSVVPSSIKLSSDVILSDFKESLSEEDALNRLKSYAKKNIQYKSYIGMGYYGTIVPNVIIRNILENQNREDGSS